MDESLDCSYYIKIKKKQQGVWHECTAFVWKLRHASSGGIKTAIG